MPRRPARSRPRVRRASRDWRDFRRRPWPPRARHRQRARVSCSRADARPIRTRARKGAVRSAVAGLAAIVAVAASSISKPTAASHHSPASLSPGRSRANATRNVTAPIPSRVQTLNHAVNAITKRAPRTDRPARRSSAAARTAPGAGAPGSTFPRPNSNRSVRTACHHDTRPCASRRKCSANRR